MLLDRFAGITPASRLKQSRTTAKAAQRQDGGAKCGSYMCLFCDARFEYSFGQLACPRCRTKVAEELIPVYTEESPETEMLSRDDFAAGD